MAYYTSFTNTLILKTWMTELRVAKDILNPFIDSYRINFSDIKKILTH